VIFSEVQEKLSESYLTFDADVNKSSQVDFSKLINCETLIMSTITQNRKG
jgi:hypothetical protein